MSYEKAKLICYSIWLFWLLFKSKHETFSVLFDRANGDVQKRSLKEEEEKKSKVKLALHTR